MNIVEELENIVGADWVITRREQMENYLADATPPPVIPPAADNIILVKPADSQEIAEILKLANRENIHVFPRGGGTGVCGGAIPTVDGIVLSLERLDRVEEVDTENLMVIAQAGVTLADLIKTVEDAGLWFPPHPGDEGAQVGGLVACNAGGTNAVKYGVVRNFVKGIEVVLPTGEITKMGGKLIKNNTGLNLMHLLIGSEGILAIITKVTFRLMPKYANTATLIVSFDDRHTAIATVGKILNEVIPTALEYAEHEVFETAAEYLGLKWPAEKGKAHLMIIVAGDSEDELFTQCELINKVCDEVGAIDILMAERSEEQANILKIRSEIGTAVKPMVADYLDTTVPPANIGKLMDAVDKIAQNYNTTFHLVGHAADGNLHTNLMKELSDRVLLEEVKHEIYQAAIDLGGVITGEHCVGKIRTGVLDLCLDDKTGELIRGIKRVFDPNNILNPGTAISGV